MIFKNFYNKVIAKNKLAIITLIAFFFVGIFTLGSFKTPSSAFVAEKVYEDTEITATLQITFDSEKANQKIGEIWYNVGMVESARDGYVTAKFRLSSSSTSTSGSLVGTATIYNAANPASNLYNWVCLTSSLTRSNSYTYLHITFTGDVYINEIAVLDTDGELMKVTAYNADNGEEKLVDEQEKFSKTASYKDTVTIDESLLMSSALNLINDRGYITDGKTNALGVQIVALGILIFGANTFGIRIMSFLFTFGALIVIYLLGKMLFGKNYLAGILVFLMAIGGIAFPLARYATSSTIMTFFVLMSLYFICKFYYNDIIYVNFNKTLSSLILCGVFFALSVGVSTYALFTAIPLIFVFILAVFTQKKYFSNNINKTSDEGKKARLVSAYNYRKMANPVVFSASLIITTVIIITFSYIVNYSVLASTYNKTDFFSIVFKDLFKCFNPLFYASANSYSTANASAFYTWLINLKSAVLFKNTTGTNVLSVVAVTGNTVLAYASALSLIALAVFLLSGKKVRGDDENARIAVVKPFLIMLSAFLATLLPYVIFSKSTSLSDFLLPSVFYYAFTVLFIQRLSCGFDKKMFKNTKIEMRRSQMVAIIFCFVVLIEFLIHLPLYFAIMVSSGYMEFTMLLLNAKRNTLMYNKIK